MNTTERRLMPAPAGNCHNPHGRPISPAANVFRLEDAAARIARYQQRLMAALLQDAEPPPLPDDYPTEAERLAVERQAAERLAVDVRHLKGAIEVLKRRLERLGQTERPARKRSRRRVAEDAADDRALELAEAALARLQREDETRLLSAGAALDRAPENVTQ